MFETKSLTGSKATYFQVGFVNGKLLRPDTAPIDAPDVAKALANLHIPTDKPVVLQYKLDGDSVHFQWAGPKRNRDYGAAFDVKNPWHAASVKAAVSPEYLSEDEMA